MRPFVAGTLIAAVTIAFLGGRGADSQSLPMSRVYPPDMLDSVPRVLSWPSRPWSDSLVRSGAPTLTTVQFLIDRAGRWERGKLWLVFGWQLGQQGLTPLVEDVLSRATFTPAIASGQPERAFMQMTIDLASGQYNIAKSLPDSTGYYSLLIDTPPELVSYPKLQYPDRMRQAAIQGEVVVEFQVGIDGIPDSASIRVVATSHPLFTAEALRMVRGTRYKPATFSGRPVRAIISQPVRFTLTRRP